MIKGWANFDFHVSGEIMRVSDVVKSQGKCYNKIVVVKYASSECVLLFREVAGIISENGGRLCHLAILSTEMGIPCVVGASEAKYLVTGQTVAIDAIDGEAIINES